MNSSFHLGRIWGIPLGINYSWFLILALVILLLSSRFSATHPQWAAPEQWGTALITALLFFGSVLAHELAHSLVAVRRGIPVTGITLFVFGGVSQISREPDRPRLELLIAIVGPAASVALGGLFLGIWLLTRSAAQQPVESLHAVSGVLWPSNLLLGIFNMLPGFPLDGGRVLRAAAWGVTGNYHLATRVATLAGQAIAVLLVAASVALAVGLRSPSSLWLALIGAFLFSAATNSQRHTILFRRLQGLQARDVMEPPTATLARARSIETTAGATEALELLEESEVPQVLVMVDQRIVGQITHRTLRQHGEAQRRRARTGGALSGLRRGMLQ